MAGQEAMPQLEKNPLDSKDSDLSVDLKQLSGYTLKSSGTFINQDKDRVKISKGAMNLIDKFKKKKIEARKASGVIKEEGEESDQDNASGEGENEKKEEAVEKTGENEDAAQASSEV